MKVELCECGEYLEVTGITVCKTCLRIHHSKDPNEINYRYYCHTCNHGFNWIIPVCQTCNEWGVNYNERNTATCNHSEKISPFTFKENVDTKKVKLNNQQIRQVSKVDAPVFVEKTEKTENKHEPSNFTKNLLLSLFCFHSGVNVNNVLKYAFLKKLTGH